MRFQQRLYGSIRGRIAAELGENIQDRLNESFEDIYRLREVLVNSFLDEEYKWPTLDKQGPFYVP